MGDVTFGENANYYGTSAYNAGAGFLDITSGDGGFRLFKRSGPTELTRIDSSGRLLHGKTSTAFSVAGHRLDADGNVEHIRDGNPPLNLNRKSSDGSIAVLYKDGSSIGSLDVDNGDNLTIQGNSSHSGLQFGTNALFPHKNGANIDATIDLGESALRWKNLHLSGGVVDNTTTVSYASSIALTLDNGAIQTVTLTGNATFTDSLNDGEAIVLMLNGGASHTVTWTAVTKWVTGSGNAAPTLTASDAIILWKIGSAVYAATAGSFA